MAKKIEYCDLGDPCDYIFRSHAVRHQIQGTADNRMQTLVCVGRFPTGVNAISTVSNPTTLCTVLTSIHFADLVVSDSVPSFGCFDSLERAKAISTSLFVLSIITDLLGTASPEISHRSNLSAPVDVVPSQLQFLPETRCDGDICPGIIRGCFGHHALCVLPHQSPFDGQSSHLEYRRMRRHHPCRKCADASTIALQR